MQKYEYLAKDEQGELKKGIVEADSRDAASVQLGKDKLTPISIKERKNAKLIEVMERYMPVPATQKVMFSKQLSVLISAGVPIAQSMSILEEQATNKKMARAIADIKQSIEDGLSLSVAMEAYPDIFGPLYTNMVHSGEVGGILDKTLEEMADEIEKEHDMAASIRGAMTYPTVILVMMIGVIIYMLNTIIPQIAGIFTEMGAKLPPVTQFLLTLSDAIQDYWYIFVIVIVGAIVGTKLALKKVYRIRYGWHRIILKFPVFGNLASKVNITRFSRTLGSLLSSGVTMLEALKVTSDTIQNEVYRADIVAAAEKVKNGSSVAEALKRSKSFPKIIPQMIAIGEETGSLDKILGKVTDFYQKEVDANIKNLSSLVEPLLMLVIGAAVGFIMVAVMLPVYSLSNLM